ncbi:SH3 domain-containing protein [Aggregatilinea lenta]|uniref:SH3 domain-containing protein n=1 Tax=Aggregatilinea lenta TaxID=913108 RepID=UPI0013C37193|nr:SH3 domain-containing protein [Aggregatilinea lenta]
MLRRTALVVFVLVLLVPVAIVSAQDPPAVLDDVLADLSGRVGATVTLDTLETWRWDQVTYPDSSLGCAYAAANATQGSVNAYRFLLTYNGVAYDYRVPSAGGTLILCAGEAAAQTTPTPAATAAPGTAATPSGATTLTPAPTALPNVSVTGTVDPDATFEAIDICPDAPASRLVAGGEASANADLAAPVMWSAPNSSSAVIGEVTPGDVVTVLDGPQCAESQAWWRIEYDSMVGWVSEGTADDYAFAPEGVPPAAAPAGTESAEPAGTEAAEAVVPAPGTVTPLDSAQYDLPADREPLTLDNFENLTNFQALTLNDEVTQIAWSPDGGTLAITAAQGVWLFGTTNFDLAPRLLSVPNGPVYDAAFNTVTGILATAHADGTVRLWDTSIGGQIAVLQGHTASVRAVAFSPDGSVLASAGGDEDTGEGSEIRLWNATTGDAIAMLEGHTGMVTDLTFNVDGTLLASASVDNTVRLWDVISGTLAATYDDATAPVRAVLFKPDGTWLAAAGDDALVRLWEIGTDQSLVLEGHADPVLALTFGLEENILATAGGAAADTESDTTLHLRDITTGEQVGTLADLGAEPGAAVRSLILSPDATTLAFITYEGPGSTIHLWGVTGS